MGHTDLYETAYEEPPHLLDLLSNTLYLWYQIPRFNEIDILAYINFGGHYMTWLQMIKQI